jgi:hypothetical protein
VNRRSDPLPEEAYAPLRSPPGPGRPMNVEEVARLVVRHYDLFGTVGIVAAITALRRVLERDHGPDPKGRYDDGK